MPARLLEQRHLPVLRLHQGLFPDAHAPVGHRLHLCCRAGRRQRRRERCALALTAVLLGLVGAMCFMGKPLALVGTPYIIIAAFAVRSLPASVRAGVAALQQIDPSIEEASSILGADAQYTFRKVTLPLILPALLAGLIFSFTRHMTSLSAIIFLVSARWRIVTASHPERVGAGRHQHRGGLLDDHHRPGADRHRRALFHHQQAAGWPGRCGSVPGSVDPCTLVLEDVVKIFPARGGSGEVTAVDHVSHRDRKRRAGDAAGAVGLRQDDHAAPDRRLRVSHARARSCWTAR